MTIDKKDALHLKKYDYKVLSKIYDMGTKQALLNQDSLTQSEMALVASAGHAVDLVDALHANAAKKQNAKLDFTIDTQESIGNAVMVLLLSNLQEGVPENKARTAIAKKVSSYLLFEIWNFLQGASSAYKTEFAITMGFDFASGTYAVNQQSIMLIDKKDESKRMRFDAYKIAKDFIAHDVQIVDQEKGMVGVDMRALFEKVSDELHQLL